jgi:phosphoribosylglycinamide formyltransferase 2
VSIDFTIRKTKPLELILLYGAPLTMHAKKMMLLGSGELGKEVIIEAQRLGVETIAVDRYANAPAMQVAHRS